MIHTALTHIYYKHNYKIQIRVTPIYKHSYTNLVLKTIYTACIHKCKSI